MVLLCLIADFEMKWDGHGGQPSVDFSPPNQHPSLLVSSPARQSTTTCRCSARRTDRIPVRPVGVPETNRVFSMFRELHGLLGTWTCQNHKCISSITSRSNFSPMIPCPLLLAQIVDVLERCEQYPRDHSGSGTRHMSQHRTKPSNSTWLTRSLCHPFLHGGFISENEDVLRTPIALAIRYDANVLP